MCAQRQVQHSGEVPRSTSMIRDIKRHKKNVGKMHAYEHGKQLCTFKNDEGRGKRVA